MSSNANVAIRLTVTFSPASSPDRFKVSDWQVMMGRENVFKHDWCVMWGTMIELRTRVCARCGSCGLTIISPKRPELQDQGEHCGKIATGRHKSRGGDSLCDAPHRITYPLAATLPSNNPEVLRFTCGDPLLLESSSRASLLCCSGEWV
jgi:hypothetical protein